MPSASRFRGNDESIPWHSPMPRRERADVADVIANLNTLEKLPKERSGVARDRHQYFGTTSIFVQMNE
jgi:hypothetical protein